MFDAPNRRLLAQLGSGERVVLHCRPQMVAWVLGQWTEFLVSAACLWFIVAAPDMLVRTGALAVILGVVVEIGCRANIIWHTRYVLTTHRAMRLSGVIHLDCEWMTWSKVTDVHIERSLADRLLGTATIRIQSANERSAFKSMYDVPEPRRFTDIVTEMVNRRQGPVRDIDHLLDDAVRGALED